MLGYVSSIVCQSPFTGVCDQKKRISITIMAINTDVHPRTRQELEYLLNVVHATVGAVIAVY
jgi:hypothetical protein